MKQQTDSSCALEPTKWLRYGVLMLLSGSALNCVAVPAAQVEPASASSVASLPAVQVNASRLDIVPFNVPAALSVVRVQPGLGGQPGVNLSETLIGVPGILVRDRQNYAQDAQISIRGFGSRSTFGVRGIRIFMDGIPSTLPDGQGQVSQFNLDSADRIEVLRGPFSVLYGNAAGGVVQLWSAEGTDTPQTTVAVNAGSNDSFKYAATTRGMLGPVNYNVSASEFLTGGYRDHSRVRRESANARFGIDLGDRRSLVLVFNRLDQPHAQDPLGLTKAQVDENPRQATAVAEQYNTRKSTRQNQLGAVFEQQTDSGDQWRLMGYYGNRSIEQFLSIPPGAQKNPLQSGGVISPDTNYGGMDARWTHRGALAGRPTELVLGASGDYQIQKRDGYENFVGAALGVKGPLRRDEHDNVVNVGQYAQAYWHVADRWALLLGLRHDAVRFSEHDFYVTARNPDDSGQVQYAATTPVLGVQFRATDDVHLHASFGRGFETPSYNELGYRSDGLPGLAFDLAPARSRSLEAGFKWRALSSLNIEGAAFRADTRDELAVATNQNGRSTYRNVGRVRREGLELSLDGDLGKSWHARAGVTHLQARFRSGFLACEGTPCAAPTALVASGSRMPGVPDNYGSFQLQHGAAVGWRQGVTFTAVGPLSVNDIGSERAAGYGVFDLDASYVFALGAARQLQLSAKVSNFLDHRYIGAVIVNDGNERFFEPGPNRSYMLGARLTF